MDDSQRCKVFCSRLEPHYMNLSLTASTHGPFLNWWGKIIIMQIKGRAWQNKYNNNFN